MNAYLGESRKKPSCLTTPVAALCTAFMPAICILLWGHRFRGLRYDFAYSLMDRRRARRTGTDVDEEGNGTIKEPRMYQLIRQQMPIIDRRFEVEFLDAGVEAFPFTFG
jgi:Thioredoxin like C-terminal domain